MDQRTTNDLRAQLEGAANAERPSVSLRGLLPSLLINVAAPVLVYRFLEGRGVAPVPALIATALCPTLGILVGWTRTRRLDVIGAISLAFITLGAATSFFSNDPVFFLVKESFFTGLFGLACFASILFLPRPLLFYIGREFLSGSDPSLAARFDSFWEYPLFRASQRRIAIVWGTAYLSEAAIRVVLALSLPIPVFLVVSHLMAAIITVALIAWTLSYGRRTARRGSALLASRLVDDRKP